MRLRASLSSVESGRYCPIDPRPEPPRAARRLRGYLLGVFREGLPSWEFKAAQIVRGTGMSLRSVRYALAWLRANSSEFKFLKRRVGRSFAVCVSGCKKGPPLPPLGNSFGIKQNTTGRLSPKAANPKPQTKTAKAINRLAGFVARRDLAALHWDNCKVRYRLAHAFNFAASCLRRGFARRAIVQAYESALIVRHRDATDLGQEFEPSSTVSLAAARLADGRPDAVRVRLRLAALEPIKAANEILRAKARESFAAAHAEIRV